MVLHFTPTAGIVDALLSSRRKTEFAGLLVNTYKTKTGGSSLNVQFTTQDQILLKKGKVVQVQFLKDEMTAPTDDVLVPVKSGSIVQIKTSSGVPPNQGTFSPASFTPCCAVLLVRSLCGQCLSPRVHESTT